MCIHYYVFFFFHVGSTTHKLYLDCNSIKLLTDKPGKITERRFSLDTLCGESFGRVSYFCWKIERLFNDQCK